jgi:hypothetical protein
MPILEGLEPRKLGDPRKCGSEDSGLWQMNSTLVCSSKELRLGINGGIAALREFFYSAQLSACWLAAPEARSSREPDVGGRTPRPYPGRRTPGQRSPGGSDPGGERQARIRDEEARSARGIDAARLAREAKALRQAHAALLAWEDELHRRQRDRGHDGPTIAM